MSDENPTVSHRGSLSAGKRMVPGGEHVLEGKEKMSEEGEKGKSQTVHCIEEYKITAIVPVICLANIIEHHYVPVLLNTVMKGWKNEEQSAPTQLVYLEERL